MTTSTKTSQATLRRSTFLFASCAVLAGTLACTGETGTEPDPQPTSEPASEPEANEDQHYGSITVRIFDAADAVVCETTLTSTEAEPNTNFRAGYRYDAILDDESAVLGAGTIDADESDGKVASVSVLLTKASDGTHDLPPSLSYTWVTSDIVEANGIINCANQDGELAIEDHYVLIFDQETAGFEITDLAATVSSADPLPGFESGWSVPLPLNCGTTVVDECQAYGATGAFSMTIAGSGNNATDNTAYRFEATFDALKGEINAVREAE